MNVMPALNPYAPRPPQNSPALMREVARRRWIAERRRDRQLTEKRNSSKVVTRAARIHRLRPGRAAASSLSPVYNMFSEAILRAR